MRCWPRPMNDRFAGAVPYLRAFARVLGGHCPPARRAGRRRPAQPLARVAIRRLLPEHAGLLAQVARRGGGPLRAVARGSCRVTDAHAARPPLSARPPPGRRRGGRGCADGILWMRLPLPMALDHVNVYALDDGDGWTIVDTGLDSRRTRAIWERAAGGPAGGQPGHRVIVTHHHPDHIGLAGWFQSRGAELLDHPHRLASMPGCWCWTCSRCPRRRRWPSGAAPGMDAPTSGAARHRTPVQLRRLRGTRCRSASPASTRAMRSPLGRPPLAGAHRPRPCARTRDALVAWTTT